MSLRLVFDRMPGPEGCTFIEAEDDNGRSVMAGEWRMRDDGNTELVITALPAGEEDVTMDPNVEVSREVELEVWRAYVDKYEGAPPWRDAALATATFRAFRTEYLKKREGDDVS